MRTRHARQIRRGLHLARLQAHYLNSRVLSLVNAPALTVRAYERARARFFPPPPPPRLPTIPGPASPNSEEE